ncbi:MAG TPA: response regulator [Propionibacteriaceae bacterium]|nr:response regulator [Propionibacteriaceae bacterium]
MGLIASTSVTPGDPSAARPIRVLFVDDSSAIRTLARFSLSAAKGFAVTEAADGSQALALFAANRPDCVVLDIEMPGLSGFDVLEELQRRSPGLPVVMLSGFSDPAMTSRAKAAGAVAYLEKSTELGQLADTVRQVAQVPAAPATPQPSVVAAPTSEPAGPVATTDDTADLRRLEYVISHDLAEPLRIMGGFATLLANRYGDSLDESGRAFVTHISDGARRMQAMVDDLLSYSRAGRLVASTATVDVGSVVTQVYAELASMIGDRAAEATAGELPTAHADPTLLKTVLRHLVTNALTFNSSVPPRVRVDGHVHDRRAVFTVTDNGVGISPTHHEEVFELFRRLNTREQYPGTGTGLTLCRRLLQLQDGTISISSHPGGGTTVTFTLPATHTPPGDRP